MKQNLLKLCSVLLTFAIILSVCVFAVPSVIAATAKHKDHIVNRGNGLRNTYAKITKGEEVNVFYFGGSVTNGSGATRLDEDSWRGLTGKWLRTNFPDAYINNINAAYGDTGSWFGLYRLVTDILPQNPDLIFIEFSINDYYDQISKKDASLYFETIIRTIREQAPDCDIVNVLTTDQSKIPNLISDDMLHSQAQAHEDIAAAYNVPTLRVGHALADRLYQEAGYGWGNIWKDYVGDIVHPTDKGYKVYFEVFEEYLNSELKSGKYDGTKVNHKVPECVNDKLLNGDMQFIDADNDLNNASDAAGGKGFTYFSDLGTYSGALKGGVCADRNPASFVIKFTGTELSVLYKTSDKFNGFVLTVDGKDAFAVKKKNIAVLASGLKYGEHTVEMRFSFQQGGFDKINIFGFFARNENKASHKHKYDNKCDKNCNVCGLTRTTSHTYKTVTTKATTKKNGSIVNKCSGCGKTTGTKTTIYYAKKVKLSTTEYTYSSSKTRKPSVKVYDYKGNKISSKYYTVSYATGRKKVGKYKVTIKLKGNYSGTLTAYFTIVPKESKVEKLTAAKKSLKVKLDKVSSQATGYEIQYSTSKTFKSKYTKTKKVSSYKTTSVTLKSLKAKKTYYVRVRTYKTVDGKKYYSDWSSKKYKKTK